MKIKKSTYLCLMMLMIAMGISYHAGFAQEPEPLPPIEDGPYFVGTQSAVFEDSRREDWTIATDIWYPAIMPENLPPADTTRFLARGMADAEPDDSAAPYPLIVYSHGRDGSSQDAGSILKLLTSHGFVVVAPQHNDHNRLGHPSVDRPLDIKTVLDGLADTTVGDLTGLIDSSNVGIMGFSMGASASLRMIGLLNDVEHFENWCTENAIYTPDCLELPLEVIEKYRAELGLDGITDGHWPSLGDERIRAVLAISPCGFPLVSEESIAAATTPILIMHGTHDSSCEYEGNAVRTYTHWGTRDRYLVTWVDGAHTNLSTPRDVRTPIMMAFFTHYLQGDDRYQDYLTADFVESFEYLAWGAYEAD